MNKEMMVGYLERRIKENLESFSEEINSARINNNSWGTFERAITARARYTVFKEAKEALEHRGDVKFVEWLTEFVINLATDHESSTSKVANYEASIMRVTAASLLQRCKF